MTDEEMADEYCNNEVSFDTTESGEKLYTQNDLRCAYLAGLKAKESNLYIAGAKEAIKVISTESLLKMLKDRGVIRSWYYNGTYHVGNEL